MPKHQPSPEERVFQATWQDGTVDLFAGLGATLIGLAWILDWVVLGPIAPALAIPIWIAVRRQVIEPRLGHVRFSPQRQGRLRRAHVGLIGLGCATLVLGVAVYFTRGDAISERAWVPLLIPALPSVLIALMGILAGLAFGIPRLAVYALPFTLGGLLVAALDVDPGWGMLTGGGVMTLAGAVLLTRFLREFPRLSSELQ